VTKLTIGTTATVLLALAAVACGDSGGSEGETKKEITRVEVAESPFKPADLENTIDGLVEALSETEDTSFDVSIIIKPLNSGYWEPVRIGTNRAIGELGLTGQVEAPVVQEDMDSQEAAATQVELFKKRRKDGYQGLAIAALTDDVTDELNKAVDDGAVAVTLDGDLPDSKRQMYVGTNNHEAGYTSGKTLAKLIPEKKGTVYCLGTTSPDWVDGYERTLGAKEALDEEGYTAIMHTVGWGAEGIEEDHEVLNDAIANADPPLVGIVGMFSNAFRGAEVAEEAGLEPGDIKIVGFDFEPDTLKYMKSGYIQATHAQRQYYMGYMLPYVMYSINVLGLKETTKLLDAQMIGDDRFDTGIDVVMADDIDEFNDFLDSLGIGG